MSWNTELAYFVTPKSGPMRPMRTLVDVNRALLDDLPFVSRLRPHWAAVARLLLIASDTGSTIDVRLATDALVRALETEGWMTRARGTVALSPSDKTQSPAERGQVSTSVSSSGVAVTLPAARAGATPMAVAIAPCRDAAADGYAAPDVVGPSDFEASVFEAPAFEATVFEAPVFEQPVSEAPIFGAPGYRPGEVVGPTARVLDDTEDLPGLILRKLPGAPARAGAPSRAIGSRQGRGTRRPADTKL
ncbi:hypothetical protein [Rhodoplanes elegans]|uniref:hypothetical protein n=1 Tax=Rhodoplanes elegans TaxID=29408 RepID=UPI0019131B60|nr:hypothetical protein [Rhodoplanes elegans]